MYLSGGEGTRALTAIHLGVARESYFSRWVVRNCSVIQGGFAGDYASFRQIISSRSHYG